MRASTPIAGCPRGGVRAMGASLARPDCVSRNRPSSAAAAPADCGRFAGSGASMARTAARRAGGRPGRFSARSDACPLHTLVITSKDELPMKGGSPASASKSTQPSEKMSARPSTSARPRACSGEV